MDSKEDIIRFPTEILVVPIDELIPNPNNARTHSPEQIEQLRASIVNFGFPNPILIDSTKHVLAGHGRILAARALGLKELPCVIDDWLTEAQKRAYIIADNRLAELAGWDKSLLCVELEELSAAGFDTSVVGFDLRELHLGEPEPEAKDDDFDVVLPKTPRTKPGQLFALGSHRLLCGDATIPADVERLVPEGGAELYLTDPPYNVDYTGGTSDKLKIENDSFANQDDFREFLASAFLAARMRLKPGAAFYIFHSDGEQGLAFRQACADAELRVRQCLVWCKQHSTLSRQDYQWQHEPCLAGDVPAAEHDAILYGWKSGAAHTWNSDRKQTTVLFFDKPAKSDKHPTMKPVALFGYLMHNSTVKGDAVLDSFAGSGPTIIAAEQLGRHAYLMEHDPRYCDVIIDRWEAFTGGKAELISDA